MNALEIGKWATVIPFERYTKRKSRTDIVSPSLTRIARWLRSWRYEVLERTGQPEANETRFLLFLPPLEAAVALSYLALPCLVLPRLTLSALLRPVLSYLALSCLVVPANVIIRDHRRGSSSNFVQHLTSFDLSSRQVKQRHQWEHYPYYSNIIEKFRYRTSQNYR